MLFMMLPVLACATAPKMTRMEQDCCRQMHGQCGDMAKQGCCQVEVRNDLTPLPAQVVSAPVYVLTAPLILAQTAVDLPIAGYRSFMPDEFSPPGLLIASISVLRI